MSRVARLAPSLALLPFLGYLAVFLVVPTVTVLVGAFSEDGTFSLTNLQALGSGAALQALWYLVVTRPETSFVRRAVTSAAGVLAQAGGVSLAFMFIATLGFSGFVTEAVRSSLGIDLFGSGWLYKLPGLIMVYCYFQIPLMVIVFMPALQGLRSEVREAATNLGASTWQYWTKVGIPMLRPAFLGAVLLLFANAFAAYATAAALVSQGQPITPLLIRSALTSEVLLGRQNLAYALALEMVVVVAVLMTLYAVLLRRTSRWLR